MVHHPVNTLHAVIKRMRQMPSRSDMEESSRYWWGKVKQLGYDFIEVKT